MSKKQIKLDDIRISSPCPTSWEDMSGNDEIRFCNICSKNVYNISSMSRGQAKELIKKKQGNLCGLIYLRKDGSIMTSDCPVGLAAIRECIAKRIAALATIPLTILSGVALFLHQTKNSSHIDEPGVSRLHKEGIKQQLPDLQKEQLRSLGYISLE